MKYDPKSAFGNDGLIRDMKRRNKALKAKGAKLCDKCGQRIDGKRTCYCLKT